MITELLSRCVALQEEITRLKDTVMTLNANLKNPYGKNGQKKKWMLRFTNAQKKYGEPKRAAIYLFDGIDIHGLDIPVEEGLVEVIRDYFQNRLVDAQTEFDQIGMFQG